MKIRISYFIFVLILFSSSLVTAQDRESIDFVMDINNVMLLDNGKVTPGASEYLDSLLKISSARIHFFSKGGRRMVEQALSSIVLSDGRSALEAATQVLTSDSSSFSTLDRMDTEEPQEERFRGWSKKDLLKLGPGINLDNVILVDDSLGNAAKGQEMNLLWVRIKNRPHAKQTSSLVREESVNKRLPLSGVFSKVIESWANFAWQKQIVDRGVTEVMPVSDPVNRLVVARGVIEAAIELSSKTGLTLREALWDIQWDHSGEYRIGQNREDNRYFEVGLERLRSVNPDFSIHLLSAVGACAKAIRNL